MKNIGKTAIALMSAFALVACGTATAGNQHQPPSSDTVATATMEKEGGGLYNIEFNEGTRCIVVDSYKSGAMTCDFTNSQTPTSGPAQRIENGDGGTQLVRTSKGDVCAVYDGYQASGIACNFAPGS